MLKKYGKDYVFDGIPINEALENAYREGYLDGCNNDGSYDPDGAFEKSNTHWHIETVKKENQRHE
jgi:hypothetical protein